MKVGCGFHPLEVESVADEQPPHPLEGVARAAFREGPAQDHVTLAAAIAGSSLAFSRASRANTRVAHDVLAYMEGQGKVRRDEMGWCFLVEEN